MDYRLYHLVDIKTHKHICVIAQSELRAREKIVELEGFFHKDGESFYANPDKERFDRWFDNERITSKEITLDKEVVIEMGR